MKNKICLVTPFHKSNLNNYEKICLERIKKYFPHIDKYLITFKENNIDESSSSLFEDFYRVNFDKNWFKSIATYNKFSCSLEFYKQFHKYEYMLMCHLDAYVISNNIEKFLDMELSYIGAPTAKKNIFDRSRKKLNKVKYFCNGGFSLRKIDHFIKVLNSSNLRFPFNKFTILEISKSGIFKFLILYFKTLFHSKTTKGIYFSNNLYVHEDTFWSYFATLFLKEYKLPRKEDCLKFAFDGDPYFYYKKNNYNLPVALHGYHNYLEFLKQIS